MKSKPFMTASSALLVVGVPFSCQQWIDEFMTKTSDTPQGRPKNWGNTLGQVCVLCIYELQHAASTGSEKIKARSVCL